LIPRRTLVVINTDLPDPVHLQVSDQVQALIECGDLEPETLLPPVRELARNLAIAPNTVGRAYATLREAGLVQSDRRHGTRIAKWQDQAGRAREAALEASIFRAIESLRYRGYTSDQIAAALAKTLDKLRQP
jgi:GntR family transcriptional regulator